MYAEVKRKLTGPGGDNKAVSSDIGNSCGKRWLDNRLGKIRICSNKLRKEF